MLKLFNVSCAAQTSTFVETGPIADLTSFLHADFSAANSAVLL